MSLTQGCYEFEHEVADGGTYLLCYFDLYYTLNPGCPAVMYLRNGDPGYPAEPAECEIWKTVRGAVYDEDSNEVYDEFLLEQAQESFDKHFDENLDEIITGIFEFDESNQPCEDDYRDVDR